MRHISLHRFLTSLMLPLLLACFSNAQAAGLYRYKDASGRMIFSDSPPPANALTTDKLEGAPSEGTGAGKGNHTEQSKAFAERQKARDEDEKKAQEKAALEKQRAENCINAKENLRALESGIPVTRTEADGSRSFLTDKEKSASTERARKQVDEWCSPAKP